MSGFKYFVMSHALYILVTAIWPLVHIESFMIVTGPKTDIWLVKTVGALLIPVGLTMIAHLRSNGDQKPLFILGASTAVAFMCIDIYYSVDDTISDIYLVDAGIELLFLGGWIVFGSKFFNKNNHRS